jgi:iron complex outermembrane receptor protein
VLTGGERLLTLRASAMTQGHDHLFGDASEEDAHSNAFFEVALGAANRGHLWVIGGAVTHERYAGDDILSFDFTHTTPSIFAQDEFSPWEWLTLSLSARVDHHSDHGTFASPRLSSLLRYEGWTVRTSVGTGYFAPTPFTEETEAVGLGRLEPVTDLEAETARSASLDIGRVFGPVEMNATLFASQIDDALQAQETEDGLRLVNAAGPTRTWGGELLARWRFEPFQITATYTGLRSRESDPEGSSRREVPLTARHAAGIVGMWEQEDVGRVGVELYYTGRQELEDNPYRSTSRPYFVTGLLVERAFGSVRVFVNAENFLDTRQTEYDPLTLPTRSVEGRWTTDVWAPLEGRIVNAGLRYEF